MKVGNFILDSVRGLYLPQFRNIVSAEVFTSGDVGGYSASRENPVGLADFCISPGSYTVESKENAGCVDIQVCISQIAHVTWAQLLEEGIVEFGSAESFIARGLDGLFGINSAPDIKNKRRIPTNQPFRGAIRLDKLKNFDGGTMIEAEYNFNNRACIGRSKFYIEDSTR